MNTANPLAQNFDYGRGSSEPIGFCGRGHLAPERGTSGRERLGAGCSLG